jgi:hypothetical protein
MQPSHLACCIPLPARAYHIHDTRDTPSKSPNMQPHWLALGDVKWVREGATADATPPPECPWFVRFNLTLDPQPGYTLWLTDLLRVWKCEVDQVDAHTVAQECPVLVGNAPASVLQCVEAAWPHVRLLHGPDSNRKNVPLRTRVTIRYGGAGDFHPRHLAIRQAIDEEAALTWSFALEPQPAHELYALLYAPTARIITTLMCGVEELGRQMDHVLQKLHRKEEQLRALRGHIDRNASPAPPAFTLDAWWETVSDVCAFRANFPQPAAKQTTANKGTGMHGGS